MFKKLLLIFCLVFAVVSGFSQTETKEKPKKTYANRRVNLGVSAGLNVSRLSTRINDFYTDNYLGFRGGVFARFNFRKFHIQPELNFSMTGGQGSFNDGSGGSYAVKFNSLELPILAGYKILDFRIVNLRLQGGVYGAYNFTRSIYVNDPNYPDNNNFTSDQTSRWNAGLVLGGGLDVWRLTIDFRYYWGLVNVMGDNTFQQDPRAGFKNGTFTVTAGFKIF